MILAPSTGCEGFAHRSVTSVPARKAEQIAQIIRVPGSYITDIRVLPEFRVLGAQNWPMDIPFLRARNPKSRVSVAKIWRFFCALAVIY